MQQNPEFQKFNRTNFCQLGTRTKRKKSEREKEREREKQNLTKL